jgi:hypothetical protein
MVPVFKWPGIKIWLYIFKFLIPFEYNDMQSEREREREFYFLAART